MKISSLRLNRQRNTCLLLIMVFIIMSLSSCQKFLDFKSKKPSSYSSEVVDKWIILQIRLMRNSTGIPNQAFSRYYVYAGIAALEALPFSDKKQLTWKKQWNDLKGLPHDNGSTHYYGPASVNAALAFINKAMFINASAADKAAIDSLENALNAGFVLQAHQATITASAGFGKEVASAVYNWAESDGYKNASNAYTPPSGPGLWVPTATAFAAAASPYWGNIRPVVKGSTDHTQPEAPVKYSTDPGSDFYKMVKKVYDVSENLSNAQKAMAMHWRDVPGVTSPGHWLSILQQTLKQKGTTLDKAVLAYALTGAAINDGLISCWQTKYQYNLIRPITYIRNVLGFSNWLPYLTTPAHPEYSSAHAVLSAAAANTFQNLFGNIGSITDHTYDYLGFEPRTYSSFKAIGMEAAQSRLYAGIHYQPSIDAGIEQGIKVSENIHSR